MTHKSLSLTFPPSACALAVAGGLAAVLLSGCGQDYSRPIKPAPEALVQDSEVESIDEQEVVYRDGNRMSIPEGAPHVLYSMPGMTPTKAQVSEDKGSIIESVCGDSVGRVVHEVEKRMTTSGWKQYHQSGQGRVREGAYRRGEWVVYVLAQQVEGGTHVMTETALADAPE